MFFFFDSFPSLTQSTPRCNIVHSLILYSTSRNVFSFSPSRVDVVVVVVDVVIVRCFKLVVAYMHSSYTYTHSLTLVGEPQFPMFEW